MVLTSLPPQVNLTLVHDSNNDSCLAMVYESRSFDISSLQGAASQGEIVIHVHGQTLNYSF